MHPFYFVAFSVVATISTSSLDQGELPQRVSGASAQQDQNNGDEHMPDDIEVAGRRLDQGELRRESTRYVRSLNSQGSFGQMTRWRDPICIRTHGLTVAATDYVDQTLTKIARHVGVIVAQKPCRTNVFIQFTPDARRLLALIEKKKPRALGGMSMAERIRLRDPGLPIRWWSEVVVRGRDGEAFNTSPSTAIIDQAGTPLPTNENTIWGNSYASSLISTKVNVDTKSVAVLVDIPLVSGKKLSSVVAYVAFVMLARVSVRNDAPVDSILSLFRADYAGSGGLGARDCRYLSALRKMPQDRAAAWQRAYLVTAISRAD